MLYDTDSWRQPLTAEVRAQRNLVVWWTAAGQLEESVRLDPGPARASVESRHLGANGGILGAQRHLG